MPTGLAPTRRWLLLSLLASVVLFTALLFVPGARQGEIFPYDELCDYRMFMLPTMESEIPYAPTAARARDACYPPIAYIVTRALVNDRGQKWSLSCGEKRLVVSIFALQLFGVLLLARGLPGFGVRMAEVFVVIMSPACICTMLRGNPSGWAFAFVCVFLFWYRSESRMKRMAAALSLGAATSLKIAPCLFGVLYLAEITSTPRRIPCLEIIFSALTAIFLTFFPFLFFGGFSAIPQWIANAGANAEFYSVDNPLWGFAALANNIIDSKELVLPSIGRFAWATRAIAVALVVAAVFVRADYRRLLFVGSAMAFLTHHDYGGAYLIPAFVAWLCGVGDSCGRCSGVLLLLEAVGWFFILTPLQIPNPCRAGSLNGVLQNEFLFVLLLVSIVPVIMRFTGKEGK